MVLIPAGEFRQNYKWNGPSALAIEGFQRPGVETPGYYETGFQPLSSKPLCVKTRGESGVEQLE
jgi:hypothetical protein